MPSKAPIEPQTHIPQTIIALKSIFVPYMASDGATGFGPRGPANTAAASACFWASPDQSQPYTPFPSHASSSESQPCHTTEFRFGGVDWLAALATCPPAGLRPLRRRRQRPRGRADLRRRGAPQRWRTAQAESSRNTVSPASAARELGRACAYTRCASAAAARSAKPCRSPLVRSSSSPAHARQCASWVVIRTPNRCSNIDGNSWDGHSLGADTSSVIAQNSVILMSVAGYELVADRQCIIVASSPGPHLY